MVRTSATPGLRQPREGRIATPRAGVTNRPAPVHASLTELQTSAGNAATTTLLTSVVARHISVARRAESGSGASPTAGAALGAPRPGLDAAGQTELSELIPAVTGLALHGAQTLEAALRAAGVDLAPVIVRALAASGYRDVNKLTNVVFWARHPELTGTKLVPSQPGFKTLSTEWLRLRDSIVVPALATPAVTSRPTGAPSHAPEGPAGPSGPGGPGGPGGRSAASAVKPSAATTPSGLAGPAAAKPPAPATQDASTAAAGDLDTLAAAARNPSVDAAVAKLHDLERRFAAMPRGASTGKKNDIGEETGEERDRLVADIAALREMVAGLGGPGLSPDQVKPIQAALYRGINAVSPYYYQHNNVIYEYSRGRGEKADIWNTCNITSLSMCLEAMGKTAADYKYPDLIPPVAEYFRNELTQKAGDVTSTAITGYRLPDVVAMVATVHHLGNRAPSDPKAIDAAAKKAFVWLANIDHVAILATYFGVTPKTGTIGYSSALNEYGKAHWKETDALAERRKKGKSGAKAGSLTTADIEAKVPAAAYKRAALRVMRPALDGGSQVVVGQFNHFVRLQSVDDDWVVKDDPGHWTGEDIKVTWEEARALGLFTNYCILS